MTEERFPPIAREAMSLEQRKVADEIAAGPRGSLRSPFNAMLRSPGFADRAQRLGAFVRFQASLPEKLKELAILVTGRHWTAQYEWYMHAKFAREAGVDPATVAAIAAGKKPAKLAPDEAAVYEFASELLYTKQVSDANFARAKELLGEQGVMDLIGTVGYYSLVSMVLNVSRVPIPAGTEPLKPLK